MDHRRESYLRATAIALAILAGCSKSPDAAVAMPGALAVDANVIDADVTRKVETALRQNDALKAFNIMVVTLKGDVRLTGVLDSQAQVDEAIRTARAVNGTHSIHDELTLKQ